MESVLLQGGTVWDGSGRPGFTADVLVRGNRIAEIWPEAPPGLHADARFDIPGHTIIPGLVEGHAHLPFVHKASIADTGDVPPEEHTLQTLHNARVVLEAGFTSCLSAAPRSRASTWRCATTSMPGMPPVPGCWPPVPN